VWASLWQGFLHPTLEVAAPAPAPAPAPVEETPEETAHEEETLAAEASLTPLEMILRYSGEILLVLVLVSPRVDDGSPPLADMALLVPGRGCPDGEPVRRVGSRHARRLGLLHQVVASGGAARGPRRA
jgi:hypothetical protein